MSASEPLRLRQLFAFFLPLGLSASLVTISHVIINSTLARSAEAETVIASYAIALSLLTITERPAVLLRQSCSALVRDRLSFRAMSAVAYYVFGAIFLIGLLVSFTPVGEWIFRHFFGVAPELLRATVKVYQILMFVSIFSAIRCLYHGIIIFNYRTKWLTIGMAVRLAVMYLLSVYFIETDQVHSGQIGAIIFLSGMIIEAAVAVFEGRRLLRTIPERKPDHPVSSPGHVMRFYKPLLYSSLIAVFLGPSINALLGKTADIELSIASYAIAASLIQLVSSFFSYMHQMVLNFYPRDRHLVNRFALLLGFVPAALLSLLCYTPLGEWLMHHVMGVQDRLLHESLDALKVFILLALVLPWLDFLNGIIMLRGETRVMVRSQAANLAVTLVVLVTCVLLVPAWGGRIGALAASLGSLGEMAAVFYIIRRPAKASAEAM
ncbi:multi antimicrobial extrusion protein MatE [Paenibacillus gansuensis]|uniref:Multi antimicrobial extrusion protein MatE n=1 Tax=Paenibacillus gansuensis TaxID=306542 RepID=A0ABW5PH15_9BACL